MRILLLVLSCISALFALFMLADMKDSRTYIEVVAFGLFFTCAVIAFGLFIVIGRLEQIRGKP